MNSSKTEIQYIDNYLQFLNVKYLDVRIELIDHLASEFENNTEYVTLEDFLRTKKDFVKTFQKKLHSRKHWGYQKRLFKGILNYFIVPKYMLITIIIVLSGYFMTYNLPSDLVGSLCFITFLIPQLAYLYIYAAPKKIFEKIQSAQYMASIMGFPSFFLYVHFSFKELIIENPFYLICYWVIGLISNIAGLQEVITCKKQIVKQYNQLIKS